VALALPDYQPALPVGQQPAWQPVDSNCQYVTHLKTRLNRTSPLICIFHPSGVIAPLLQLCLR